MNRSGTVRALISLSRAQAGASGTKETPVSKAIALSLAAALTFIAGCEEKQATKPVAPAATKQPAAAAPAAAPATTSAPTTSAPATSTPAAATPAATAPAGASVSALGLAFPLPSGWKSSPPSSPMRLAEVAVPDASTDPAKACSITFSTAGGEIQANIDRWAGQVLDSSGAPSKPNVTKRQVAGMAVTTAEMTGKYAGMGDSTPRENWTMRASIIETPGGLLFIKMTGPAEQMAAAAKSFDAMVDGLKKQ